MGEQVRIELPEPHYTLFDAVRSGKPEIIVVNDALLTFRHTDIFPWHLEVTIDARDLADNGMPTPEESKVLFEMGDRIEKAIEGTNALFLSRSTWNGCREISFRVHDPEIANTTLQDLIEKLAIRPWEYEMKSDPGWSLAGYAFKLFPLAKGQDA